MSALETPGRISKRTRYDLDLKSSGPSSSLDTEQQQQQQQQWAQQDDPEQEEHGEEDQAGLQTGSNGPTIETEIEETKRMVAAFDAIDLSMNETRDKLKTFYKTADETNTLLDMWIRVLSQTEHTQKLLQDPAWEGQSMEEARDREYQERRAAYQQAMEEASGNGGSGNRRSLLAVSPHSNINMSTPLSVSSLSTAVTGAPSMTFAPTPGSTIPKSSTSSFAFSKQNQPLKKSPSALVAAAHAHASAIAANRKRNAMGAAGGAPPKTNATITGYSAS